LALTPEGEYVQVNGDIVQTLNASRVRAALGTAHTSRIGPQSTVQAAPPAVIVRRKRRIPVLPGSG
jgi:hypothetical protein